MKTLKLFEIIVYPSTEDDIYFDSNLKREFVAAPESYLAINTVLAMYNNPLHRNAALLSADRMLGNVVVWDDTKS